MLFPLNDPNEYLIWLKHFHMNSSRLLPQSDVNGPSREGAPLWAPPACLSCSLNPEGPSQPPSSVEGALFSWSFHWSLVSIGFPTYLPPPSPRWPRGVCVCVCVKTVDHSCQSAGDFYVKLERFINTRRRLIRSVQMNHVRGDGNSRLCCLWKLHESSGELLSSVHLCSTRCKSIWRSCSASRTRRFPSTAVFRWIM